METTAPARPPSRPRPVRASPSAAAPDLHVRRPAWLTGYTAALVVLDAVAMGAATLTAKISWLGIEPESLHIRSWSVPYGALALLTVPTWVALLALAGAYDLGPFATTPRPLSQVVRAGAQLLALIAVAYYILHLELLGRGVLVGLVPLAVALTLVERVAARVGLNALRRRGRARRATLVVGPRRSVDEFVEHVDTHPTGGVAVADALVIAHDKTESAAWSDCTTDGTGNVRRTGDPSHESSLRAANGSEPSDRIDHQSVAHIALGSARPTPDAPTAVSAALADTGAAAVVVTGGLAQEQVRDIAWMLEGTGIALLVTPAPAEMPGVRSTMRPVAGLPLLHLNR